ncbi:MAG: hypothetical protein U0354_05595 [Candidatus Sericytochromatia bacterium]
MINFLNSNDLSDKDYFKNTIILDNIIYSYFEMNGKNIIDLTTFFNNFGSNNTKNEDILLKLLNYIKPYESNKNYQILKSYIYYKLSFAVISDISSIIIKSKDYYSLFNNIDFINDLKKSLIKITDYLDLSIKLFPNIETYLLLANIQDLSFSNYYLEALKIMKNNNLSRIENISLGLKDSSFNNKNNILIPINYSNNKINENELIKIIAEKYVFYKEYDKAIDMYNKLYNFEGISKEDFYISLIKIYELKNDTKNYIFYIEKLLEQDKNFKYKDYYKVLAEYYSDKNPEKSSYYYNKIFGK